LRRETRCQGTEFTPGSRRDAAVFASWVALPGRRSEARHRTKQAQRPFVSATAHLCPRNCLRRHPRKWSGGDRTSPSATD
jgi:hypothetical protein